MERVNQPLGQNELEAVRLSAQRGRPLGDERWVKSTVKKFKLESAIRPRGRQRIHPIPEQQIKEA